MNYVDTLPQYNGSTAIVECDRIVNRLADPKTSSGVGSGSMRLHLSTTTASIFDTPEIGKGPCNYVHGVCKFPLVPESRNDIIAADPWGDFDGVFLDDPIFDEVMDIIEQERKDQRLNR